MAVQFRYARFEFEKRGFWNGKGGRSRTTDRTILRFYKRAAARSCPNDAPRPCESRISELRGHFF